MDYIKKTKKGLIEKRTGRKIASPLDIKPEKASKSKVKLKDRVSGLVERWVSCYKAYKFKYKTCYTYGPWHATETVLLCILGGIIVTIVRWLLEI